MKRPSLTGAACLAVILAIGAGGSAPPPASGILQYEQQTKLGDRPPRKMDVRIWFKGDKFRVETNTPQGKAVTLGGPDGLFSLQPGSAAAVQFPAPTVKPPRPARALGSVPGVPFGNVETIRQHWRKVGSERVGRYPADIYEPDRLPRAPALPKGQVFSTRVWVGRDVPVPVKTSMQGTSFQDIRVLKSAQFNVPISDTLFQLPRGTKIRPLSAAPGVAGALRQSAEQGKVIGCLSNVKQLAVAVVMYTQDHDQRMPAAGSFAAASRLLKPYLRSQHPFQCPATGKGYLFNTALSGKSLRAIAQPASAPVFRDGATHPDGSVCIGFADGHAQRLPATDRRAIGQFR